MSSKGLYMAKIDKEFKANHIDDEALAAFIDDRLSNDERYDVIEHLAECDSCRKVMMNASSMKQNDIYSLKRKKFLVRYLVPLALAASLVLVVAPIVENSQDAKVNMSKKAIIVDEEDECWFEKVKDWIDNIWENIIGEDDE